MMIIRRYSKHFDMPPEDAFTHCGDKRIKLYEPTTIAIAALAVAAVGTGVQYFAAQEAAGAQRDMANKQKQAAEKQFAAQQKQAELENIRSTRAQIRQARAAQAQIVNLGATSGTSGSSGVQGGVASVGGQLAGNIGYMGQTASNQAVAGQAQLEYGQAGYEGAVNVANAQAFGALGGAMSSIGGTVFQGAGGFKTVFKQ
jgi:hypothetical protein